MLVFLEDISLLAERVQQSKLAALGRLTASINKSADLFDAANVSLEERLGVEVEAEAPKALGNANGASKPRRLPVER